MTAPSFVGCIAGNFGALPVEDVSATMAPDDDAGFSYFFAADSASSICSYRLSQCCYCWWCSCKSCARPANEALSTLFVSSKARVSPVV